MNPSESLTRHHGELLNLSAPAETSLASRLLQEAYENLPTAAVGAAALATVFGTRAVLQNIAKRRAISTLSPSVFYIESKIAGAAPELSLNQGSGFLVSKSGHIATSYHVVSGASEITIFNKQGQDFAAKLVGFDAVHDIAILKLEQAAVSGLAKPVVLHTPPQGYFNRSSFVLGHPDSSYAQIATSGRFVTERTITGFEARTFKRPEIEGTRQLILELGLSPGYSGAPLADLKGRVFGLATEGKLTNARGAPASTPIELMKKLSIPCS